MTKRQPSLDLIEFIESQILPRYNAFDKAHNLEHVTRVIRNALELASMTGADIDMVYVTAAYHDLGMSGPRAAHHITGGKILKSDARLRRWFSDEQINVMRQAVEDHRASASRAPRSVYGMIVAEADRDLAPMTVLRRTVEYGLSHYPRQDKERHYQRFLSHLEEKYAEGGYIRLWINGSPNDRKLRQLRGVIKNQAALRKLFDRIYDEEAGGTAT